MLSQITWQGYWISLAICVAIYYFIIYFCFFRRDFQISFPAKPRTPVFPSTSPAISNFLKEQIRPPEDQKDFPQFENEVDVVASACTTELAAYFEQSKKEKVRKLDLLQALGNIIQKYPSLKPTPYREPLIQLIISEAKHICSIQLTEDEVFGVWIAQ